MTDQKPREYTVKYLEPKLGCGMNRTFDPPIELIEKSAYTAKCKEVEELVRLLSDSQQIIHGEFCWHEVTHHELCKPLTEFLKRYQQGEG